MQKSKYKQNAKKHIFKKLIGDAFWPLPSAKLQAL